MSVGSVLIGLQASRADSRGVTAREFVEPLEIHEGEAEAVRADGGEWASGMVYLSVVRPSDFAGVDDSVDAVAPTEAFDAGVIDAFRDAAGFLDRRPPEVTARLRACGLSLRLFVEVRMDQDQMELEFPPEFLAACGRHGLRLCVITNDISATEVFEARPAEPDAATDDGRDSRL